MRYKRRDFSRVQPSLTDKSIIKANSKVDVRKLNYNELSFVFVNILGQPEKITGVYQLWFCEENREAPRIWT